MAPHYTQVADAESKKKLMSGYPKTIYPDAEFDSVPEKVLADILARDGQVVAWARIPVGQIPILYGAGDTNYNPDFIADDGTTLYLLEVKSAAEKDDPIVQRKAQAAQAWCRAATAASGRRWVYKLIPHDSILSTDSFAGVVSKAMVVEERLTVPTTTINEKAPDSEAQESTEE